MNRIVVHIDRLVLRGVDHVDPAALQAALQAELRTQLGVGDVARQLTPHDGAAVLHVAPVRLRLALPRPSWVIRAVAGGIAGGRHGAGVKRNEHHPATHGCPPAPHGSLPAAANSLRRQGRLAIRRVRRLPAQEDAGLADQLAVGAADDVYEREAERVAQQVAGGPALQQAGMPRIQRLSAAPGAASMTPDASPPSVETTLAAPGRALEPEVRQDMERRLGHDFSRVRVHTDAACGTFRLQELDANAYTAGARISHFSAPGRYAPRTCEGRRSAGARAGVRGAARCGPPAGRSAMARQTHTRAQGRAAGRAGIRRSRR